MTRCACLAQRVPRCQQFRETLLSARSSSLLEVLPACHDDLRHDELLGRAWCVRLPADPVSGGYVLDKCAPPLLVCLYLCLSWLVLPRSPSHVRPSLPSPRRIPDRLRRRLLEIAPRTALSHICIFEYTCLRHITSPSIFFVTSHNIMLSA